MITPGTPVQTSPAPTLEEEMTTLREKAAQYYGEQIVAVTALVVRVLLLTIVIGMPVKWIFGY